MANLLQYTTYIFVVLVYWYTSFWQRCFTRGNNFETSCLLPCKTNFFKKQLSNGLYEPHKGKCVWYGNCGPGFNPGTHLNCPSTDETRMGPYMKNAKGLEILKRICPYIYKVLPRDTCDGVMACRQENGDNNTRTCCSESQITDLENSMRLGQQLLSRCPSCWDNFRNYFCQLTCGLNQSDYIWPNMSHPYPPKYHYSPKGIPAITVLLTNQYAIGFYNSCKDVRTPSFKGKAVSLFCGEPAQNCSAFKFLSYLGNTGNGKTAFEIDYIFANQNRTMPDNKTLTPLNASYTPCNAMSESGKRVCSCQDCASSCCAGQTQGSVLQPGLGTNDFYSQFRRPQLVISRPNNHTKVKHYLPPPSIEHVNFTSMFGLEFLHEVLELQTNITELSAPYKEDMLSFKDICYKSGVPGKEECTIESVLQYWQNNMTRLDMVIYDPYHIFELADYLDHFLSCTYYPYTDWDTTKLNMSCRADNGAVMKPMNILGGYDGLHYQNATDFVISFYLNTADDEQRAKADAWEKAVNRFIASCPSPNMTISFWP